MERENVIYWNNYLNRAFDIVPSGFQQPKADSYTMCDRENAYF